MIYAEQIKFIEAEVQQWYYQRLLAEENEFV